MKKIMFGMLFLVVLCGALAGSVYATSVSVESSITQDFHVVYTFSEINSSVYENLRTNGSLTRDTIPTTLFNSMAQKGRVRLETYSPSISFDNATRTIVSTFNLRGQSIVNSTINRGEETQTYQMDTTWRKFYLNVTNNFHFNFTRDFAQPVSKWTVGTTSDVRSYSYSNSTAEGSFAFSFQLPSNANNINVDGDTLTFDTPYTTTFTDNFINSPILILIALAVVGLIIFLYRKF